MPSRDRCGETERKKNESSSRGIIRNAIEKSRLEFVEGKLG